MFYSVARNVIKFLEIVGCVACLIIKVITDQHARQISFRNQKYSREWSLLRNVTWTSEGNNFATIAYGGFIIITVVMCVSKCTKPRLGDTLMEKMFLLIGLVFFVTLGSLVYASLDQVPFDLQNNAIVMGSATYLVAFLFLVDLLMNQCRPIESKSMTKYQVKQTKDTQTEQPQYVRGSIEDLIIPPPSRFEHTMSLPPIRSDIVNARKYPEPEEPVLAKVINVDKFRNRSKSYSHDVRDFERYDAPVYPGFVGRMTRLWERKPYRTGELQTIV